MKDGVESDVDCGGATCPKCQLTAGCVTGPDCETGVCEGGQCVDYYVWAKRFGDSNSQWGDAVAVDGLGNTFLAGQVKGTVNFGGATLTAPAPKAITLAKFDSTGAHIWSKVFTGGQLNHTSGMTTDFTGRVLLTGTAANGSDFGGGPLTGAATASNFFVAKLDTGGNHLWSRLFSSGNGKAIATSSAGEFFVLGELFSSTVDFGCGNLPSSGAAALGVAKFSGASNTCLWSKRFGGTTTTSSHGAGIAVDASGNTIVAGMFSGSIDFGCGGLSSATNGTGSAFVAKLDPSGACVWSKAFGDPSNSATSDPEVIGLNVDSAGNIYTAGYFAGTLDFGKGAVTALGQQDIFIAALTPSGTTSWFKQFGSAPGGYQEPIGFTVNTVGKLLITGSIGPDVDFGGGALATGGLFMAELDLAGNHLWSRTFGPGGAYGASIAYSGMNDVVLTGWLLGQLDFGGGALTTMGNEDIFLAKLLLP
ncbi:MAG: hypothetical protein QM820_11335 [Minicystis sp.]